MRQSEEYKATCVQYERLSACWDDGVEIVRLDVRDRVGCGLSDGVSGGAAEVGRRTTKCLDGFSGFM